MQEFFAEINQHPFLFWIACSILAGLLEVLVPSFSFIFATLAAIPAAIVSLGFGWPIQVGAFLLTLVISFFTLRKFFVSRKKQEYLMHSRVEAVLGKTAMVTESITANSGHGRVLVEGQDWAAKSKQNFSVDQKVFIESSDGIVLIVRKV